MYRKCNVDIKDIEVAFQYTFSRFINKNGSDLTIPVSSVVNLPAMNMAIGSQIKYYRGFKGITQEQLGNAVGVSKSTIMRIENNEMLLVNLSLLDRLVSYLGIENKVHYEDDYIQFIKNNPADQIKAYRKKESITMYELSKRLNVSYTAVKKWESGKSVISRKCYDELKKLLTDDVL